MKKVLLATTVLLLSAGVAAADVSVGGDGRMGIISTDGADAAFTSRIRISFSASGETDGGLTFGGSIRADNAAAVASCTGTDTDTSGDFDALTCTTAGGGVNGAAGSVYVSGSFGKLSMGDVSGAVEAAVGDAAGVGLTGLGDFNELAYLSNATRPAARWDLSIGDLGLHVSADNPGPAGDQAYSVAVTYSMGDVSMGLGVEDNGEDSHVAAGVSAALGDASFKLVYGSKDDSNNSLGVDDDQYAASISYAMGAASLTAFTEKNFAGQDHYGVGAAYDLGGGASLVGGIADGDSLTDASYDFGLSMSF
jgi:outer membrane protein OmpU